MNLVDTSTLYLDYPLEKVVRVTKLLETAAKLHDAGSDSYHLYLKENTQPNDIKLKNIISELMFSEYKNTGGSHDYMGVTVYKNPDKTYSCPELGIYSVENSAQMKEMIKGKRASKEKVQENINLVIDNILGVYNLTESQFIEYVLEDICLDDYVKFGGNYFTEFVSCIAEVSGNTISNSLIHEGYVFDEGIGDFVRGVAYKAKGALEDGVDRHTAAQVKFGQSIANSGKNASAVGDKIKSAVGKTFTKRNLNGVMAVVNAAATGVNKTAGALARSAEVGAKTFDNINTDALESKRAELRAKNAEDPKAKIDREAEAAPISKPSETAKKKITVKDKEAAYDKAMAENTIDAVKIWLDESGIFDTDEELNDFIMTEMTSEDIAVILDSLDLVESAESIANQQSKMARKDAKAKTRQVKDHVRKMNNSFDKYFTPSAQAKTRQRLSSQDSDVAERGERISNHMKTMSTDVEKHFTPKDSYPHPVNNTTSHYNAKDEISKKYNANSKNFEPSAMTDNEASRERVRRDMFRTQSNNQHLFEPSAKEPRKPLGKAIAPPKNRNAVVPTSKSYNTPLGKAIAPPTSAMTDNDVSRERVRRDIFRANSNNYHLFEPSAKAPLKPLGKAIAPPKNRNAVVPTSKSYNTPLGRPTKPPESSTNTTERKISGRPSGYMTNKPMPQLQIPTKSTVQKAPAYGGKTSNGKYTALSTDNLLSTPLGKYQKTKEKVAQSLSDNKVKPSSVVSTFGDKTKSYAKKLLSKLNPLKESIVINWLSEEELLNTLCWLIESEDFTYQEELFDYLNNQMSWKEFHNINELIDNASLETIVECLHNESEDSDRILNNLYEYIGSEYYEYILDEEITNDSDVLVSTNREPIKSKKIKNKITVSSGKMNESKDCSCDKRGCKPCDERKYKFKLYSKIRG